MANTSHNRASEEQGKRPPSPSRRRRPPPRRRTTSRRRRWRGCGRGPLCIGVGTAMTLTLPPLSNRTRGCGRDDDACVRTREARGSPRPFLSPSLLLLLPLLASPVVPPPHRLYYNMVFFYFFGIGGKNRGGAGRGSLANFPSIQHKGCT